MEEKKEKGNWGQIASNIAGSTATAVTAAAAAANMTATSNTSTRGDIPGAAAEKRCGTRARAARAHRRLRHVPWTLPWRGCAVWRATDARRR